MYPSDLRPSPHSETLAARSAHGEPGPRGQDPRSTALSIVRSEPEAATAPPDPRDLRRVQRVRKAVLAVAILAFLLVAAVTRPLLNEGALTGLLPGIGVLALFTAIIGRAWCSLYIGGRKTREIVATGPYSISRNPLYVFSFLAAFGVGAQTGSLVLAAAAVGLAVVILGATIRREEAWLSSAFGEAYGAYSARTPRFWPRWSAWRDDTLLEIRPARFVTTLLDGAFMLMAVPVMAGLARARATGIVPTWLVLP
ncbi:sodium:proton antiporter [Brevundimonas intermedia]|uniref:Sodium:proton antiporter n=1 Tax=Brevundimonas intermedia TaxID=74315 RepID=A0ABQ5TBD0_9CAUL|nr:sodium:proton antiporter [Brevundimonas intermedia]